jgi:selenocysteine-specific elongation factor
VPIIGTAGHVDHGKSTLVLRLTGRDPDRLAEEKARGLTIDLGFAWAELAGDTVGFVDVPGHERFIKNMLAGVGGIDVALFVIAADEGWMPQTEEHHAVLDLLGIRQGVIALTRVDIADPDLVELVQLDVADRIAGTAMDGWPMVPVSGLTGEGIAELTAALAAALDDAGKPRDSGRPRLWVDRSFVIAGAGTVVTGTLVGGTVRQGDELELWPQAAPVRVRSVQSHERNVTEIGPGSRTALNLAGIDRVDVQRGAMLAKPGHFRRTKAVIADLRAVRGLGSEVTDRGAYHAHIGSGTFPVRLRLLSSKTLADPGAALLRFSEAIPLVQGDRLILRETGRKAVVAGGTVLDPHPASLRMADLRAGVGALRDSAGEDADTRAGALVAARGTASLAELAMDTGGGTVRDALVAGGVAMSRDAVAGSSDRIAAAVAAFHEANPLRPGMPKAAISSQAGLPAPLVDAVVATVPDLVDEGSTVRTASFGGGWGERQEAALQVGATALRDAGLAAPRARDLGMDDETLHAAVRSDRLVRVADDLVYLPEQIDEIRRRLGDLPDGFTVAEFRDALGMTRRQAVPLLEWLDRTSVTSRQGDVRRVRRRP